jgi:hypothetical protein
MGGVRENTARPYAAPPGGRARSGRHLGRGVALGALGVALLARPSAADSLFSFRDRAGVIHFTNVPTDRRFSEMRLDQSHFSRLLFSSSPRNDASIAPLEAPADLAEMITETAKRYDVEPALVHAVVRAESAFDHRAVSSAGAMGLMQLMPDTAMLVGVRNAFHPQQNVEGGVSYLRMMLDRFSNNVALALAAYNAGPGAVESYGGVPPYPETQEYIERVLRYRQEYLRRVIERSRAALGARSASASPEHVDAGAAEHAKGATTAPSKFVLVARRAR